MTGTIYTENGNLYVKDYYSNKHIIKVTLTNNENEQMYFSSGHSGGNPESDNDVYSTPPNFKPLMTVRDVLKQPDMEYIKYKRIEYTVNGSEAKRIPTYSDKYKGLNGKKVSVIDLANNKEIMFMVGQRTKEIRRKKMTKEERKAEKEREMIARLTKLFEIDRKLKNL